MRTTRIKNILDARIAPYRSLKMRSPEKDGLFITENTPSVRALLASDMDVVSCVTTEKLHKKFREEALRSGKGKIQFYIMDKPDIEDLIGFKFHHGIMMAARLPARKTLPEIEHRLPSPRLIVALNGVHDPQNVGLISRNLAAFGADAMVVDSATHEPYYRKVTRISLGAIFGLNVAYENDLPALIERLKEQGTRIVVPALSKKATSLERTDLSGDVCIVMGNEYTGASEEVKKLADISLRIPHLFKKTDSLNVACASAVIMYQAYLQRQHGEGDSGTCST